MTRRILGQCHQADFASIEHLVDALENPEMLDTSTLTNRQKFAFYFLAQTIDKGIPWRLVRSVIQEILFWGEGEKVAALEIKFALDPSKRDEVMRFKRLWRES